MQKFYTDKTKRRLNRQGRALFTVKAVLNGASHRDIAATFGITLQQVISLYGDAAGLLGLYSDFPEGTPGFRCIMNSDPNIIKLRIDIAITKQGERLWTTAVPNPVGKPKVKTSRGWRTPVMSVQCGVQRVNVFGEPDKFVIHYRSRTDDTEKEFVDASDTFNEIKTLIADCSLSADPERTKQVVSIIQNYM